MERSVIYHLIAQPVPAIPARLMRLLNELSAAVGSYAA